MKLIELVDFPLLWYSYWTKQGQAIELSSNSIGGQGKQFQKGIVSCRLGSLQR